jgi:ribosome-associated toxin RatA of RatAB toxin-antitoxin module
MLPEALRRPRRVGRHVDVTVMPGRYSTTDWQALQRGEIITAAATDRDGETSEERTVYAAAIIPYPPEQVWAVLADFEERPKFLPGAKEIHIVRVEGNRVWLDERLKFMLVTIRYRVINTLDPERGAMSWVLDKTAVHDIADTEGAWRLTALTGERTLVTYRAWVDTGQPLPGFLESFLMKRSLPALIEGLRGEALRRAAHR